jgi:hypothetical protein
VKRRRAGWPPLTSAKKASANVAGLDRAVKDQDDKLKKKPDDKAKDSNQK